MCYKVKCKKSKTGVGTRMLESQNSYEILEGGFGSMVKVLGPQAVQMQVSVIYSLEI